MVVLDSHASFLSPMRSIGDGAAPQVSRVVKGNGQARMNDADARRTPTREPGLRMGGGGFTVLEVIVVIVVAGILATVAFPRVGGMLARIRTDGAADQVVETTNLARSRAVSNPRVHCGVSFNVNAGEFLPFFDDNGNGQYNAGVDRTYDVATQLPAGTAFYLPDSAPISNACVIFQGDGSAIAGGGIGIRHTRYGFEKRIYVKSTTGEIKLR
jgi:prepilin-type N-terminal cleavage/methylation domain-containing protein